MCSSLWSIKFTKTISDWGYLRRWNYFNCLHSLLNNDTFNSTLLRISNKLLIHGNISYSIEMMNTIGFLSSNKLIYQQIDSTRATLTLKRTIVPLKSGSFLFMELLFSFKNLIELLLYSIHVIFLFNDERNYSLREGKYTIRNVSISRNPWIAIFKWIDFPLFIWINARI
jgi:hypothetical protein